MKDFINFRGGASCALSQSALKQIEQRLCLGRMLMRSTSLPLIVGLCWAGAGCSRDCYSTPATHTFLCESLLRPAR